MFSQGITMYEKKEVPFTIYSDQDEMLQQIVEAYELPDKSKAIRCLLDYVEENDGNWDDMFQTVRCNHC